MAEIPALCSHLTPIKCNFTHIKKGNKCSFTHYIRYLQNKHSLRPSKPLTPSSPFCALKHPLSIYNKV